LSKKLIRNKDNHLSIKFLSADRIADSLANIATIKYPSENNRNFIRKAQYHFGWDFAPKLTTLGIWRNIKLEIGKNLRVEDIQSEHTEIMHNKRIPVAAVVTTRALKQAENAEASSGKKK